MRAYRVAYDGRAYHGFQRQPDVATVEDALLDALGTLGLEFADAPPGWAAAGRTDAGVSALAQTVAFEAPEWLSPRAFSAHLPEDVHAWASASVPADFHATHDARRREYTYFLPAPEADPDRIAALERRLAGEHDFHNLAAEDEGTVRELAIESRREGQFRRIVVRADGFPRQLVRRLVALYDQVARGAADLAFVDRVLDSEPLPGPQGVEPAPATGLVLTDVEYEQSLEPDQQAAQWAREAIADRRQRDQVRAAVGAELRSGVPGLAGDNA